MSDLAEKNDIPDETIEDATLQDDYVDDHAEDKPEVPDAEKKASGMGWRPKDEWKGDEDDWSSAKRFLQTREIIESNKHLRSDIDKMNFDFDSRIQNLQKFHQQNLNSQIQSLKDKRDSAAADADMETYQAANEQLDVLQKQPAPVNVDNNQQQFVANIVNHPVTQSFIQENPWINENGAKGTFGKKIFADWVNQNANNPNAILEQGLSLVKESVNREFPQINPNRETNQSMGEKGGGARRSVSRNKLTMNDLTRVENNIWHAMGNTWKSEKEFLQAVADDRKGA